MKNILFFFTYLRRSKDVFDLQTTLLLKHFKKGDFVTIVVADENSEVFLAQTGRMLVSAQKYEFNLLYYRFVKVIEPYDKQYQIVSYVKNTYKDIDSAISDFSNVEQLKNLHYKDYKLGTCIVSSLIDRTRDHRFPVTTNKDLIKREIEVSRIVLDTIDFYVNKLNPDLTYVHNGRLAHFAPVVIFCKKNNLNFNVFEFPFLSTKYHLVPNTIPHDVKYRYREIMEHWENSCKDIEEKVSIANKFFISNQQGKPIVGINFTGDQNKNNEINLPANKEIITFFNSSIDEFASVPGWEKYIYLFEDEVQAIQETCEYYKHDNNKHFVLRIHPNLSGLDNTQMKNLKSLDNITNLTIFKPESDIFSYQLVEISSKIITFGSTIGIEATFAGKPSILLGLSFYENLDVCYKPNSKDEYYSLVSENNLIPKPVKNTYPYGYWALTYGEDYEYNEQFERDYYSLNSRERKVFMFKKIFSYFFLRKIFSLTILKKLMKKGYRKKIMDNFVYNRFK